MIKTHQLIKVQIVSRYVPAENRAGHFTYVLDFMRYLHRAGCVLELVVLDQWCHTIPQAVQDIAKVSIMRPVPSQANKCSYEPRSIKALLRPFYSRLPYPVLHPVRQAVYRLRGKQLPGIHEHDTFATEEEIVFIASRFADFQPDVMIANQTYLGNILSIPPENPQVLKTILTIHLEHQRSEDFKQAKLRSHDSVWDWEKERNQLQYADVLLAIQKTDAEILKKMSPKSEVLYAPMSAQYHAHEPANLVPGRCLFIGSDIDHNVYGLQWFLEHVWPVVIYTIPDCSLHVCGTVCSKISGSYPNAHLLGRVDKLEHEYAAAEVCVIPLIVGSGLKIKLVEALSHGRACVSTSVGVQGLQELTNKAVLVADTPKTFAHAVVTVLKNPEKRKFMEKGARDYIIGHLAPEKVYQPFVDRIYHHVASTQV